MVLTTRRKKKRKIPLNSRKLCDKRKESRNVAKEQINLIRQINLGRQPLRLTNLLSHSSFSSELVLRNSNCNLRKVIKRIQLNISKHHLFVNTLMVACLIK